MFEVHLHCASIQYSIRYSPRARRRRIVVKPGLVEVVAPRGDSPAALHKLMREKAVWVLRKKRELEQNYSRMTELMDYQLFDGSTIPFRGERIRIRMLDSGSRRIVLRLKDDLIISRHPSVADEELRESTERWLKKRLRDSLLPLVEKYSNVLGAIPGRIRIQRMKTRWGSCSSQGNLGFNLKLIHLHPDVTEYVVAHEVCHLRYRDHSRRFRELFDSILPDHLHGSKRVEDLILHV